MSVMTVTYIYARTHAHMLKEFIFIYSTFHKLRNIIKVCNLRKICNKTDIFWFINNYLIKKKTNEKYIHTYL